MINSILACDSKEIKEQLYLYYLQKYNDIRKQNYLYHYEEDTHTIMFQLGYIYILELGIYYSWHYFKYRRPNDAFYMFLKSKYIFN